VTRLYRAALLALAAAACDREGGSSAPASTAASAAQAGPAATPAPAPSTAPSGVWAEGAWTGAYDSTPHRIDLPAKQGGLPAWAADEGKAGVGKGSVKLAIGSDGRASGEAEGALGKQEAHGAVDGEALALRLVPAEAGGFAGTFTGKRDGSRIVGTLNAASGDGLVARAAAITLTRVE
jgi:hypothetical protein